MKDLNKTKKRLADLQTEIEDAKQEMSEMTGEKKALMKQMKEEFGINTIEKAKARLLALQSSIEEMTQEIEVGFSKLEQEYEW